MPLSTEQGKDTYIIFLRHGSVHNPQNIYYGRLPRFALSSTGRQEASTASDALQHRPLSAVYASPMLRARQTAEIIAAPHTNLRVSVSRLLNEVHTPFDGWDRDVLDKRAWDLYTNTGPNFEQPANTLERITTFIRLMRRRHHGQHVAAVAHGDIIAFLILWTANLPVTLEQKRRLGEWGIDAGYPAPASLTELIYHGHNSQEPPDLFYQDISAHGRRCRVRMDTSMFATYQKESRKTWNEIAVDHPIVYPTLGLANEAGEVAGKIKKIFRDRNGVISDEDRTALKQELGDVLWYLTQICTELDLTLEEVAETNLTKLFSRLERGQIGGDGDYR